MALVKIISGAINSGKTTTAEKVVVEYRSRGLKTAGFLSVSEGDKESYYFMDLSSGKRIKSVSAEIPFGEQGWIRYEFSRFYFSTTAFEFANALIRRAAEAKGPDIPDIVFIDEIGPLELAGGGCIEELKKLMHVFDGVVCIVIRESLVEAFSSRLQIDLQKTEIIRVMPSN